MNAPSVRRWSHHFMAKVMGLLFIIMGLLVLVFFGISQAEHFNSGMTLGTVFLVSGGILCIA